MVERAEDLRGAIEQGNLDYDEKTHLLSIN